MLGARFDRVNAGRFAQVPMVPLVLDDAVEGVKKTSKALEILKKIGALPDVEKSKDSKSLRAGKGRCCCVCRRGGGPAKG